MRSFISMEGVVLRRKALACFAVLLIMLSLLIVAPVKVTAATDWYVDAATGSDANDCLSPTVGTPPSGPCKTIQGAVGKALGADTINVATGTYVETVTIPAGKTNLVLRSVVLNAAVIQGSITVQATGVTIDGFRIQITGGSDGIYLQAGAETAVNNLIEGPVVSESSCLASGSQQSGIKTQGGGNYAIRGNMITGFCYGMNLDGNHADPPSTIDGNHISKAAVVGIILQVGPTGFGDGATIANNVIEDGEDAGMVFGNANYRVSGNIVRNNGGQGVIVWGGLYTTGIVIECNLIENNWAGIYLMVDNVNAVGNVAHNNNIVGNSQWDVYSAHTAVFDATSNWWGQASGPSNAYGNVLYDPWLTECAACAAEPSAGCPLPPVPVGGYVTPTNKLGLFTPWLIVIGLAGCIGIVVVVAKKRRR